MARSRIHHEEKRNQIIVVALNQFMLNGYEKTSIQDIMVAGEISKGALYHYFSSKDEILDAVLDFIMESEADRLQSVIADPAMSSCDKLVRLIVAAEQDRKPEEAQQALEDFKKTRNSVFHYRLQEESLLSTARLFSAVISEGIDKGDFRPVNQPEVVSELIAGALQTIVTVTEVETEDTDNLESRIEMFIHLLQWSLGVENGTFNAIGKSLYKQIVFFRGSGRR